MARFTPGAHRHGYYITLTDKEEGALKYHEYALVTNGAYKRGDYFEIKDPNGSVIDPIQVGRALEKFGV